MANEDKCCGLMGKIFGHKFRPRYDENELAEEAAEARVRADRMAVGLGSMVSPVCGDLGTVIALRKEIEAAKERITFLEGERNKLETDLFASVRRQKLQGEVVKTVYATHEHQFSEQNVALERLQSILDAPSGYESQYKIEFRPSDGRLYVYTLDGKFLWSGQPRYNAARCAQMDIENGKLLSENKTLRDTLSQSTGGKKIADRLPPRPPPPRDLPPLQMIKEGELVARCEHCKKPLNIVTGYCDNDDDCHREAK
jgi:hypothetical protein